MKKILLIVFVCTYSILLSQPKVDGIISVNEYSKKIISQYDGEHFWVIHNSKINIVNNKGEVVYNDIVPRDTYKMDFNLKNNIFYDFDKTKFLGRFMSLASKKPIGDYIYRHILPYDNGTYFAAKEVNRKTEYIYFDKNLNVLYKIQPDLVVKKLNVSVFQASEYTDFRSIETYRKLFGTFNDGIVKNYNPATKKFGFIKANGTIIVPSKYKKVGDFSEGLAFFKNDDNLYGFLNTKGEVAIPAKYSKQPYSFFSNRAKVLSKSGRFGFIDNKDQLIIDAKYQFATNFYKNYALVRESPATSILLIDTMGNVVATFDKELKIKFQEHATPHQTLGSRYEYLTYINPTLKQLVDFKKGIFQNRTNRDGLVDMQGNVILDFNYWALKDYNNGLVLAIYKDQNNQDRQGLINEKGEMVIEVGLSKF